MVSESPLFDKLAREDLEFIASRGVLRRYPRNAIVITEGDESDSLYVLRSGRIKAYLSDDSGKEVTLSIQGPGEYFGELALIDSSPRSASVITLEPCEMSVVSRADFKRCLAENPQIAFELIGSLVARVRTLTDNVRSLALLDVYGRVARVLLNLAQEQDGLLLIGQRLTHQEIANMVGASREMVSRIMKDLTRGGYVEQRGGFMAIPRKLPKAW